MVNFVNPTNTGAEGVANVGPSVPADNEEMINFGPQPTGGENEEMITVGPHANGNEGGPITIGPHTPSSSEEFVNFDKPSFTGADGSLHLGPSVPASSEEMVFVDEKTGMAPIIPGSEEFVSFSKPEASGIGFDSNRPEVSEEFVVFGTPNTGNSQSAHTVIGSFDGSSDPSSMESFVYTGQNQDAGSAKNDEKSNEQFLSFGGDLNSKVEEILGGFTQQLSEPV